MAAEPSATLAPFRRFLEFFGPRHQAYRRQAENAIAALCKEAQAAGKGFNPALLAAILELARTHQQSRTPENSLSRSELRQIANRAQGLWDDVRELRKSNFVIMANLAEKVPPGDLLHFDWSNPEVIQGLEEMTAFDTLIDLPALAKWYISEFSPGTDGALWAVCRYIKRTTGRWHDPEVVAILQPLRISHTGTTDALKMWRRRRCANR